MRTRAMLVGLFAAGLAILAAGCKKDTPKADLVIASPHDRQIEDEFEAAFSAWHEAEYGRPVTIEWRDMGGTTQLTKAIKSSYQDSESSGIDIYFGGGAPDHVSLAKQGCLDPIDLPAETLAAIPEFIDGVRQYDVKGGWYGACLSSFGILYNEKLYKEKGLSKPKRWRDLASPQLLGWTAAAGPHSGSARAAYELMLQSPEDDSDRAPGAEPGDWSARWGELLGFWGNCESFTEGASDVPPRIKNGQALAGTCIDFYARKQIADTDPGVIGFVLPEGGTVFTPDPIGVLKGAPNKEMAQRFVEFVLSADGQALWCLPAGADGGPKEHPLYRQPIRKDVYETHRGKMIKELDDDLFAMTGKFQLDGNLQAARVAYILPDLMRAAAIDNDKALRAAWALIVAKGKPEDLMKQFRALPSGLATIKDMYATAAKLAKAEQTGDKMAAELITSAWRRFFREKYKAILDQS